MPSRSSVQRHFVAIVFALTAAVAVPTASDQQAPSRTETGTPAPDEIERAINKVKADPNLATERTVKSLRWKESTPSPNRPPPRLNWLAGLFAWMDQSARLLVWIAAAVLVGFLAVWLIRMIREYDAPVRDETFVAPTHVRDLDIRPETLPADIGGTARALWDAGDHRASVQVLRRHLGLRGAGRPVRGGQPGRPGPVVPDGPQHRARDERR